MRKLNELKPTLKSRIKRKKNALPSQKKMVNAKRKKHIYIYPNDEMSADANEIEKKMETRTTTTTTPTITRNNALKSMWKHSREHTAN